MRYFIFMLAIAMTLSSFAVATECVAAQDWRDVRPAIAANGAQQAGRSVKLAMGPTSAPHFQGGTGETASQNSPKMHHKAKHRHHS
jgi:hypothetical protein